MKLMILGAPSDIHCIRWANAMQAKKIEVLLCYVSNHEPRLDELNNQIRLIKLKVKAPWGYYANKKQLQKIIKDESPDIVHVHYASGYGTLGRLAISSEIPSMLSVYGSDIYDFPFKNRFNYRLIKKNLDFYKSIGSTSNAMAKKIVEVNDEIYLKDIVITPFGVDRSIFFKKNDKKKINDKIIFGSVKKLSSKYGIEYSIKSIKLLIDKDPDLKERIEYRIYGEGPQKKYLEELVKTLNISENVSFYDRVNNNDVPQVLNTFDYFLAPSTLDSESFGVSVVEAMSVEVPIIASNVDGFIEVLNKGKCGLIVKRKDEEDMAEKIMFALKNPIVMNKIVNEAKNKVIKEYQWNNNVEDVVKYYKLLIKDIER